MTRWIVESEATCDLVKAESRAEAIERYMGRNKGKTDGFFTKISVRVVDDDY